MRKYFLAAAAIAAVSSPAPAQPYVGIEGGVLFPKGQDGDLRVDYTTTQLPLTPLFANAAADTSFNNVYGLEYKRGSDIDLIAGYDFGMVRLETELGRKRATLDEFAVGNDFIASLNTALNRPSAAPDPGAPGLPELRGTDFDRGGTVKVRSIIANALFDFGDEERLSFYAGAGLGTARVRLLGDSDNAWAGQLIAGLRYAVSSNVDVGLKYRYFRTGKASVSDSPTTLAGNPKLFGFYRGTPFHQTTNATLLTYFEQKFRSHSLLASLIFNFGSVAVAPPPPPLRFMPMDRLCCPSPPYG